MSEALPLVQRGKQLLDLRRYAEAEATFREALALSPTDPDALHLLAICQYVQPGGASKALPTIDAAIASEPNEGQLHASRSIILTALSREKEALAAALEATRLDPDNSRAWAALGRAHAASNRWAEVEKAARQALSLDPEDTEAATMLAHALRLQGRHEENAGQIAGMLQRDAEDDRVHAAAGWSALQQGRTKEAEAHFLEALRLDPSSEFARQGLLESFKARNAFYRAYLRYVFFMQGLTGGQQWLIILGLIFVPNIGRSIGGIPGLLLVTLYWYFVVWVHCASTLGNFFVMFDRAARHALKPAERRGGLLVGLTLAVGLVCTIAGLAMGSAGIYRAGDIVVAAAVPFAHVFSSRFPAGTLLFAALGLVPTIGAVMALAQHFTPGLVLPEIAQVFYSSGFLCVVASTWLASVPSLKRQRE
jgi:Flp pilus assembly protein TadD